MEEEPECLSLKMDETDLNNSIEETPIKSGKKYLSEEDSRARKVKRIYKRDRPESS